jgi:uncharacterized protein YraI
MKIYRNMAAATAALLASAGCALAAPAVVETDLNLRSGPGTQFSVIGVLPAGATVDVGNCTGAWCMVSFAGGSGFASSSYLAMAGSASVYAAAPSTAYRGGYYGSYGDPRYAYHNDWSYGPGVGVTFGASQWDRDWSWREPRWGQWSDLDDQSRVTVRQRETSGTSTRSGGRVRASANVSEPTISGEASAGGEARASGTVGRGSGGSSAGGSGKVRTPSGGMSGGASAGGGY